MAAYASVAEEEATETHAAARAARVRMEQRRVQAQAQTQPIVQFATNGKELVPSPNTCVSCRPTSARAPGRITRGRSCSNCGHDLILPNKSDSSSGHNINGDRNINSNGSYSYSYSNNNSVSARSTSSSRRGYAIFS